MYCDIIAARFCILSSFLCKSKNVVAKYYCFDTFLIIKAIYYCETDVDTQTVCTIRVVTKLSAVNKVYFWW